MNRPLFAFALVLVAVSCKKEEEGNGIPSIEFVSMSETEVTEFENQITLVISFKDENGDIGETDPDIRSISVKDARLELSDWYHVPPMTPNLEQLDISGTLSVVLSPVFKLGNGDFETTNFSIQLKDRAGNTSNTVTSSLLTINQLP